MWIMLNDAFLSIVHKDCARDEVLVRARRPGDIQKIFPNADVTEYTRSDYQFRARVKKIELQNALVSEVERITYANFKSSVADKPLHDAYLRVWTEMSKLQPLPPYSGGMQTFDFGEPEPHDRKKRNRRAKKGM
jgi:hypothetical protein